MQSLSQIQFQVAFEHGAVQSVAIEPCGAQFAVRLMTLTGEAMLVQARKAEPRLFGTVDSAFKLLHKLGVRRIVLERLERWQPEQAVLAKRKRPRSRGRTEPGCRLRSLGSGQGRCQPQRPAPRHQAR
jgi:hypothetical protein